MNDIVKIEKEVQVVEVRRVERGESVHFTPMPTISWKDYFSGPTATEIKYKQQSQHEYMKKLFGDFNFVLEI